MIGKCTFQMALNYLKIDNFEKNLFWGDRELYVL